MAKPYIYKGWLGQWCVLFPNNAWLRFDKWVDAVSFALTGTR